MARLSQSKDISFYIVPVSCPKLTFIPFARPALLWFHTVCVSVLFKFHLSLACVCVCECMCLGVSMCNSDDNFMKLFLSFPLYVGLRT